MGTGNFKAFDFIADVVGQGAYLDGDIETLLCEAAEQPRTQQAIKRLYAERVATASVASLYSGFRSEVLWEHSGWALAAVRISSASELISIPSGPSHALYLRGSNEVLCRGYADTSDWDARDIRPDEPLGRVGERRLFPGDFLHIRDRREFYVPYQLDDALFLKLEGPTENSLSVAFLDETLVPVSVSFADHENTARDFFASFLLHLLRDEGEEFLESFDPDQRDSLVDFIEQQALGEQIHLVTRWKFTQALGSLSRDRTQGALRTIANVSSSEVGQRAKNILRQLA